MRTAVVSLLVVAPILLAPADARADGDLVLDREAWLATPEWEPPAAGVGSVPRIDLTDRMPPPGNQSPHNSCVGWSLAYAVKSYHESLDQGWLPDADARRFSPYFVWTQLNGGRNTGINVARALDLVKTQGCCTWNRMPKPASLAGEPPDDAARAEAANFRFASYYRVTSGSDMRRALQEGHPIVVSIVGDPVFQGGRFETWTPDLRRQGAEVTRARGMNRDEMWHALVVVGYDDDRGAFRLMNSWGPEWADRGLCWASYELFASIPNAGDDDPLLWVAEAWVATDERTGGRRAPTGGRELGAAGSVQYGGLAAEGATWLAQVYLTGSPETLDQVAAVAWDLPDGSGGTTPYPAATGRDGQFSFTFRFVGAGEVEARARVAFQDGAPGTAAHRFSFGEPPRDDLRLATYDRYAGVRFNLDYWEWTVRLEGNPLDLADVAAVTYHLDPAKFPVPDPMITDGPATGFPMTTSGWEQVPVGATIHLRDGSTLERSTVVRFTEAPKREMRVLSAARYGGTWGDRHYWYWTAWIDGPLDAIRQITRVAYTLPPDYQPQVWEAAYDPARGFPLSSAGYDSFDLVADVLYSNGQVARIGGRVDLR
jgi:hypothetical protein